jgi:L-ascorbate metabolism protein UlaG (beta-lactamase superfamily)
MFSAQSIRLISQALLTLGLVVGGIVKSPVGFAQTPADGQGKVKIEWLGHEFYRLTSPKGVVVITSPWLGNPDGPVPLDSLARTDFILVPNAHNDDMGNPIEIAALSGATVITPGPLGNWLIEKRTQEGAVPAGWSWRSIRLERHYV